MPNVEIDFAATQTIPHPLGALKPLNSVRQLQLQLYKTSLPIASGPSLFHLMEEFPGLGTTLP